MTLLNLVLGITAVQAGGSSDNGDDGASTTTSSSSSSSSSNTTSPVVTCATFKSGNGTGTEYDWAKDCAVYGAESKVCVAGPVENECTLLDAVAVDPTKDDCTKIKVADIYTSIADDEIYSVEMATEGCKLNTTFPCEVDTVTMGANAVKVQKNSTLAACKPVDCDQAELPQYDHSKDLELWAQECAKYGVVEGNVCVAGANDHKCTSIAGPAAAEPTDCTNITIANIYEGIAADMIYSVEMATDGCAANTGVTCVYDGSGTPVAVNDGTENAHCADGS